MDPDSPLRPADPAQVALATAPHSCAADRASERASDRLSAPDASARADGDPASAVRSSTDRSSTVATNTDRANAVRVPCNLCASPNHLPASRLGMSARCGHCRSPLMTGAVAAVRASRLERIVATSDLPVLVHVVNERVPAERRRDAALETFARELRGVALVYRLDAERDADALATLGVSAVPSLALTVGGSVVSALSGGLERDALGAWVTAHALDALHG